MFRSLTRAVVLILILSWLMSLGAVMLWERRDDARAADAIVVLGAAQYDGRPSPVLKARLDHAVSLWDRHLAPRLVLTGGMGDGDTTSEAAVGRRYDQPRAQGATPLSSRQRRRLLAPFSRERSCRGGRARPIRAIRVSERDRRCHSGRVRRSAKRW